MHPGSPAQLSVVIPAHDAAGTLADCLRAVKRSAGGRAEVIVVDDGSTDDTGEIARRAGVELVRHVAPKGPARARNAGARRAAAPIVLFVDADVALAEEAIPRVLDAFTAAPDLAAVFGSYDDAPASRSLVSDYRNLLHHFVHQTSQEESTSFWGACGAVRTTAFFAVGGFDERYERPSIEDIELGSRFARAGFRVRLDKQLVGRHLKRWTLARVVLVDIRDRAYPWARLILRHGRMPADLNLQHAHRLSAVLVWLGVASAVGLMAGWPPGQQGALLLAAGGSAAGVTVLNRGFYRFLLQRRGVCFTLGAALLHALYYAYASATFAWCWVRYHTLGAAGSGEAHS
jgi:GT2 family glycosyltransferase